MIIIKELRKTATLKEVLAFIRKDGGHKSCYFSYSDHLLVLAWLKEHQGENGTYLLSIYEALALYRPQQFDSCPEKKFILRAWIRSPLPFLEDPVFEHIRKAGKKYLLMYLKKQAKICKRPDDWDKLKRMLGYTADGITFTREDLIPPEDEIYRLIERQLTKLWKKNNSSDY